MKSIKKPWVRRFVLIAALLSAFILGLSLRGGAPNVDHSDHTTAENESTTWTCSMHPQIQMPEPGQCPICGMDLIPLRTTDSDGADPQSLTLSRAAQKIAEVQTTPVIRQTATTVLRMVGKLEADETRVREISAWVPGRIDRLYIDYTGVPVNAGEQLFDLYSPDLYSAQEELLQSVKASQQLSLSSIESTRRSAIRTIEATRERLRLWGLSSSQITEIESRGTPSDHITITAPLGGVVLHKSAVEGSYVNTGTRVYTIADLSVLWLKLNVYESDIGLVKLGQTVEFVTDAFPGEPFSGTVSFIDPMLDERSRSVKVRVNVNNEDGRLKPGMFARASVQAVIDGNDNGLPLLIPTSAPLVTGTRAVVYIENPGQPGQFQGREIVLGLQAGDFFVVHEGLLEGERVVTNGSFKIDSALQILAKKSMMNPDGGGPTPGHRHGPTSNSRVADAQPEVTAIAGVPDKFSNQIDDVIGAYLKIRTALSRDNLNQAKSSATAFQQALLNVEHRLLPHAGHEPWGEAQNDLGNAVKAIASATDIKTARLAFFDLSRRTIDTVRLFNTSGDSPLYVYHCPMAMDGAGADWLQGNTGTENPYYGSQMFKCGSQTETLVAGPSANNSADHTNH